MTHYCIFEVSQPDKTKSLVNVRYIDDYGDNYDMANDMCQSMNNFREQGEECLYVLRKLSQQEYDNVSAYNPFIHNIVITTKR